MRLGPTLATIATLATLTRAFPLAAAEAVGVAPVEYRLVGEDEPSPQKARMVEEQVAAAIGEAGRVPKRRDVPPDAPLVRVAVEESGALYEFTVEIVGGEVEKGRFTGPFAGMLQEVRRTVRRLVEGHFAPAPPEADPPPEDLPEDLSEDLSEDQSGAPRADPPVEAGTERNPLWVGSLVLTAAGGVAMIAGIVLFFVDDPCVDETQYGCKEYLDTTVPAIPLAGLGGIAAALGIAGLVALEPTRPSAEAAAPATGRVKVDAGVFRARGGAGLGLSLRF